MGKIFATTNPDVSEREKRNMNRSRRIAADGMVLLQNDGTLPLKNIGKIALYGNGARSTIKGGTGSGDVNSRIVVNVEQGLEDAGFTITTKAWMERYEQAIADAKVFYSEEVEQQMTKDVKGGFWYAFNNPFQDPMIVPVTNEDVTASDTDTAIFVISRKSGEGKDRKPIEGDYELYKEEENAIRTLAANYKKLIVILNIGAAIVTKFLRSVEGINAILLMSQAGNIGGYALADVLTGKVTPGGRLTATWAENYTDYPGAEEFSHMNGNLDDEYYKESIYVGYRYFDTFNVTPAYPFGYGLSYTTFDVNTESVTIEKEQIRLTVKVKNTDNILSGREVVQVYCSAPQGRIEKPYQELIAFAKTKELAPGEEDTLSISFAAERMASFDTERALWVMEAGDYLLRVGTHSRKTRIVAKIELKKEAVTQRLHNHFKTDKTWDILSAKDVVMYSYPTEAEEKANAVSVTLLADDISCKEIIYREENRVIPKPKTDKVITVDDVKSGNATLDELVGQLTIEEMAELSVGSARAGIGSQSVVGVASLTPGAAGDTAKHLFKSRGIRSLVMADGPAGLRLSRIFKADNDGNPIPGSEDILMAGLEFLMDRIPRPKIPEGSVTHYQYCTAIPIATLLAQTWDITAWEEAGDIVGEEMKEFGIQLWLAPGMNIQRNPLCGRNYEYFSEDPLLTGWCAAMETIGVQKHSGVGTTIKHFAFNNQEDNRMRTNAYIDERAIREIYLKGYEIAIKEAKPFSIMTSYNLIQEVHTANSKELLDYIARDEWGFDGIVMTDWGTTGSLGSGENGCKYDYSSAPGCIKAGNDVIMPGSQRDVDEIMEALNGDDEWSISLADLQACAKRMIQLIMKSSAYES